MDAILSVLGEVNSKLTQSPQGAEIFDRVRKEEITVDEAVVELIILAEKEGLIGELTAASGAIRALAPYELDPESLKTGQRPLWMETSTGIPQLNPLYEASIIERTSLDGDAPELRFGPFPRNGTPAVPVETTSLDPVFVGAQLRKASSKIMLLLEDALEDHAALQDRFLLAAAEEADRLGTDPGTAIELARKNLPAIPTGVPGYRAGEVPPLMKVEVDVEEVAGFPAHFRQHLAYTALATTQGRSSLVAPIKGQIQTLLTRWGFQVVEGTPEEEKVQAAWVLQILGQKDLNDRFNFITVAAATLAHQLDLDSRDVPWRGRPVVLDVRPYNGISDRCFGWIARLSPLKENDHDDPSPGVYL